jgi:hypothetical protein
LLSDFTYFTYGFVYCFVYDGIELMDNVDTPPPKALAEAWLMVSSVFYPRHYEVILINAVDYFTGHF